MAEEEREWHLEIERAKRHLERLYVNLNDDPLQFRPEVQAMQPHERFIQLYTVDFPRGAIFEAFDDSEGKLWRYIHDRDEMIRAYIEHLWAEVQANPVGHILRRNLHPWETRSKRLSKLLREDDRDALKLFGIKLLHN